MRHVGTPVGRPAVAGRAHRRLAASWRPGWTSGRWTAPPPSAASTSTCTPLGERIATTRPTAIRVGLGLQRHPGAGQAIRAIARCRWSPAISGTPVVGRWAPPVGHHRRLRTRVARPAGMPAPPARSINMSRLAAALTGEADPPVTRRWWSSTPTPSPPRPTRTGCAGLAPRRPVHRGAGATLDRHLRLRRRGAAGHHAARTPRPAHVLRSPLHDAESAGARAPGEALPNTEIFRRIAAALGWTIPGYATATRTWPGNC